MKDSFSAASKPSTFPDDSMGPLFPPLEKPAPRVFDRREINAHWPGLPGLLDRVRLGRSYPGEPMGLVAHRSQLGGEIQCYGGTVLLLVFPEAFEPSLPGLVVENLALFTMHGRDYDEMITVSEWTVRHEGHDFTFRVPVEHISELIHGCGGINAKGVTWLPVVIAAGDSLVSTGLWVDRDDTAAIRDAAEACREYAMVVQEFPGNVELAKKIYEGVPTSHRVHKGYWQDEDGRSWVHVHMCKLSDVCEVREHRLSPAGYVPRQSTSPLPIKR